MSHSFNSVNILSEAEHHAAEIVEYDRLNLIRVYPVWSAILSANYDPAQMWYMGIQVVALNAQNYRTDHSANAKGVQTNQGFFLRTGGYQLKPDYLLNSAESLEGFTSTGESLTVKSKLTVKILELHGLEKVGTNVRLAFVQARLHGCPSDKTKWKSPTAPVRDGAGTFNDNEEILELRAPEVAVLTFEVYSKSTSILGRMGRGTKVAYFSFPVGRAKNGNRHTVPLLKPDSTWSDASITFSLANEKVE